MDFVRAGQLSMHYILRGNSNGQTLVFINALGTDLRIWDAVAAELETEYLCLRFDLRGQGLSDCPIGPYTISDFTNDLDALISVLDLTPTVLVGISIGGLIAMGYGLAYQGRVSGLVLSDTAARIGSSKLWDQRIDQVEQIGMTNMAPDIVPRWVAVGFAVTESAKYAGLLNLLSRQPSQGYTASCAALRDADLRAEISNLDVKTLVLCGEHDVATPTEVCRDLAGRLPNSEFALVAGAGHLPCVEEPVEFSRHVREFVKALS
jgi:3-oxoadipate enol-lactonase